MTYATDHILRLTYPVKDKYHRIKLYERQKLWEGRWIKVEKKQPKMLEIIMILDRL